MINFVSTTGRHLGVVVGVVAALYLSGCTGELEDKLAAAEGELTKTKRELSSAQSDLAKAKGELTQKTEGLAAAEEKLAQAQEVGDITAQLDAAKTELASLTPQLDQARAQLDEYRAQIRKQQELVSASALKYRTVTRSRVRLEPSTDAMEVAVVPQGNVVQVFEIVENGKWYKVGGMGYIFHELLEPVSE